jgi:hypothetical protein
VIHDDRAEFSAIIDDTWAAFDRDPRPGVKEKFWEILNKFPILTVRRAFDRWVDLEQRVPTPAAIKKLAFDLRRADNARGADQNRVVEQAAAPPWHGLVWGVVISVGVKVPDASYPRTTTSPTPCERRLIHEVRRIAAELRTELGDRADGATRETAKRAATQLRHFAKENGWQLNPQPAFARLLARRIDP